MRNFVYGGEVNPEHSQEVQRLMRNLLFQHEVLSKILNSSKSGYGQETIRKMNETVYKKEVLIDKQLESNLELSEPVPDTTSFYLDNHNLEPLKDTESVKIKSVTKNKIGFNKCDQCGKTFGRVTHLNRHMKALHSEKTLKCPHCDYKTSASHYLQSHLKFKHEIGTDNFYYTCHICGKQVKGRSSYNLHTTTAHSDVRSFFCEVCGNGYKDKGGLVQHMKLHGEKKFSCEVCGELFKAGFYLNRHMRAKHLERNIECDVCGVKFVRNFDLKYHKRTTHENNLFSCDICRAKFKHQSSVHKHVKKNACSINKQADRGGDEINYSNLLSIQALSSIQVGIQCSEN